MEESKDGSGSGQTKATSIMALKNKFDNKPETAVKPNNFKQFGGVAKYGGGGNLNVFAAGPGDAKTTAADKKPTDKTPLNSAKPISAIPNGTPERSSKLNIPSAFQNSSPEKPQPATKPFRKPSTSDANNNPNTSNSSEMAKAAYGVKGIGGKFEPNKSAGSDAAKVSPRGGSVSAIAGELFKEKSPLDLKTNLRKVSDSKFNFENKTADKADTNAPKQIDFRKNLHHHADSKPNDVAKKPWQKPVSLTRKSDGKIFKKVDKFSVVKPIGKGPEKPEKLDVEIDFEKLALDFKMCIDALEAGQSTTTEEEGQEEYDDVGIIMRSQPQRQDSERVVSLIPTMTDEEEAEWNNAGFTGLKEGTEDLPPPPDFIQEDYDDVAIRPCGVPTEESEELYEPLPDELDLPFMPGDEPPPPTGPKPTPPPVTNIHKKDEDGENEGETPAERKKREKAEKEAKAKKEKELKKKEKELAKLMKDYKITAEQLAMSVSKGRVKATQKGSHKLDVPVTEGDRVEIIRIADNVKGRWLIRLDNTGKVGYVDSNNIEVDTDIIKASMKENVGSPKGKQDLPEPIAQETYEDVEGEAPPVAAFEDEEIYEECN